MTPFHYPIIYCRAIDADTLEATIDLGFKLHLEQKFRLARIDAPEASTPEGKTACLALVEKIQEPAWNGEMTLSSLKPDKYGRWLCELYVGDENVNDWLLKNGYAKEYGK